MNEVFWAPAHVTRVTGGQWLGSLQDRVVLGSGVSIDSRTIQPGQLFIAIQGENFDGHDFVSQALMNGAPMAIVEASSWARHPAAKVRGSIVQVEDTRVAIQRLAEAWRWHLSAGGCRVIAVAGSNGKTTTRHLIYQVLTCGGLTGTQSPKSFNNHLGVSLTLLAAQPSHDFVACEIGTNHPGEIEMLAGLVCPDIAVITAIGGEHLEFFGSVGNVAKEEASILEHVVPGGKAFVPAGSLWPEGFEVIAPSDVELEQFDLDADLVAELSLPGEHNRRNASAAAAVALTMNVGRASIRESLAMVTPLPGRFQTVQIGLLTVVNDAYNANLESMSEAIATLREEYGDSCRRLVLIFGDMAELGEAAVPYHRAVGCCAGQCEPLFGLTITIGSLAELAASELLRVVPEAKVRSFDGWCDDLADQIAELLDPGDVVLLKASRAMGLERLIPVFRKRFTSEAADIEATEYRSRICNH